MPTVSKITKQKTRPLYNLFIDGKFATSVSGETLIKFALKSGKDIKEEELQEIIGQTSHEKYLTSAILFINFRPRSRKEVVTRLKKKGATPEDINSTTKKLESYDLLDDTQFAQWWIEGRLKNNPKSKHMLFLELTKKGVDKEIARNVIDRANTSDLKAAQQILLKKEYLWRGLSPKEILKKATWLLGSRGFDWETIKSAVELTSRK